MSRTVAETLDRGRARLAGAGVASAALDALVLLEHATGLGRAALLARSREPLREEHGATYDRLVRERERRIPLAYVTGEREFWSLPLRVDRRVLVPRPETETLVEGALQVLRPGARFADVGTGSGAVAVALARELGPGRYHATDRSAGALCVARANAEAHGVADSIEFLEGDLLAPLAGRSLCLDGIVSNLPYVPTAEVEGLEPEVRDHEPRGALDGGADGLELIRRLVDAAPALLRAGGWLLLEVGAGQAGAVQRLLARPAAFDQLTTRRDLAGLERVVVARKAA